ncbi:MAG: radical SAM protein [Syntrophobacteria bacterium]
MSAVRMVYADASGQIYEHPHLEMAGASAGRHLPVDEGLLEPLPPGSELFILPGRLPVGFDRTKQHFVTVAEDPYRAGHKVCPVAAFMAPAYTQLLTAAYEQERDAPVLPLFSYTAVGWKDGQFLVAGTRVDPLPRQDIDRFDAGEVERRTRQALARRSGNRLIQHLGTCALTYGCPAAKNYFLGRWEAPLPTSPQCNAGCLGCISLQTNSPICACQDRISFVPTSEEVAEVAAPHLENAGDPVASFGQGCEGEPLLQAETLAAAIDLIRSRTGRGTLNLNTNGSLPHAVASLRDHGLDSIRVSINSAREVYYNRYFRPRTYGFSDVIASLRLMKARGGFCSINLLCLPGLTDAEEEVEAIMRLIDETGLDLIQLRNISIDPVWYLRGIGYQANGPSLGIREMMARIRRSYPHVKFGYFNPCLDPA